MGASIGNIPDGGGSKGSFQQRVLCFGESSFVFSTPTLAGMPPVIRAVRIDPVTIAALRIA
jgi:hypothetical protein